MGWESARIWFESQLTLGSPQERVHCSFSEVTLLNSLVFNTKAPFVNSTATSKLLPASGGRENLHRCLLQGSAFRQLVLVLRE